MNLIRRISASFASSVESAVCQLENHEAVVRAALKDTQAMAARARVRLARVQQDGTVIEKRLSALEESAQQWQTRAIENKDRDEDRALECLRRHNLCQQEIETTAKALAQHRQQENSLQEAVKRIESRLREIEGTRNMLRSRQSTAEAQRAVSKLESGSSLDLDDVLERWEMRILETEYACPVEPKTDGFAAEFEEHEDLVSLKRQLQDLDDTDTNKESDNDQFI